MLIARIFRVTVLLCLSPAAIFATGAATPSFSVAAGTYQTYLSVTIKDATAGAIIYYTTTGLAPTTASAVYKTPISITATTTLRAIAALPGQSASPVETAIYTIVRAATPTFSLAAGSYQTFQKVAITDATPGAVIYYTANGGPPTTASTVYKTPIPIDATTTVRAIAVYPNGPPSYTEALTYTIALPATPTFSLAAGSYPTFQKVAITDATPGVTIYYTANGGPPNTSSSVYKAPIPIDATTTLRAIAVYPNGPDSYTETLTYSIVLPATPKFTLAAGSYPTFQKAAITDATPGTVIYYTANGGPPNTTSPIYKTPIPIDATTTLRAIAVLPNGPPSYTDTITYTIVPAATPTFSPVAGTYTGYQHVTITDATPGTTIYYTTTGIDPTASSARYIGPIFVPNSLKLRAKALFPGGPLSATLTGNYTIYPATTPVFTPNSTAGFFAMDVNHLIAGTPWPLIPTGAIRLWNTITFWQSLNPAQGSYTWNNLDKQLAEAKAHDASVLYTFGGVPPWAIPTNVPIESIARSNGQVTVKTSAPHGLYYNRLEPPGYQIEVAVAGVSDLSFNGKFYLTGTPAADIFTFAQAGANASATTGKVSAICSGTLAPTSCSEPPASLADWDEFVTQMIDHIGPGAIQYWELWDEPNNPDFWKGSPQLMLSMATDERKIIKTADPKAVILSPGVTGSYETAADCAGDPGYCGSDWLATWFALGGNRQIDGVAFHGYPAIGEAPEQIQGAVDLYHYTMAEAGIGTLPLVDTESSWAWNTNLPAETDQAAWTARHLLLEHSMGVQRTFWYAYDYSIWGTLWTPLVGLTPAGEAYDQTERWLTGATLTAPCSQTAADITTFTCGYTRPNGYSAQAIWNTAADKTVTVPTQFVQYHDLEGHITPVSGGKVQISTTPILLETKSAF